MPSRTSVPGERKLWLAYLLWLTVVGHRWYLGKLSPVYTLTLGYGGIMWLLDFFRIPKMVREYNSYVYLRHVARTTQVPTTSMTLKGSALAHSGTEAFKAPSDMETWIRDHGLMVSKTKPWQGGVLYELEICPFSSEHHRTAFIVVYPDGRVHFGCNDPSCRERDWAELLDLLEPGWREKTETPTEKALRWAEPTISVMEQLARTWDEVRAKWASSKKFKILAIVAAVLVIIAVLSAVASKNGKEETRTSALVTTETEKEELNVSLKTPSGLTVSSPSFTIEGITEPGAEVLVLGCANAPIRLQAREDGSFTAALTLNEGTNHLTVSAEKEGRKGSASCALTYQVDEASYKAQCRTIEFKVLNKNPDAYKGQKYFATGQVVQILESLGSTDIRLNVTRDQWGYWEDTIYVTYAGTVPAYEESIVRVWGEIKGSYSYTSVAGWNITLPWVEAKYIEVVQR